MSFSEAICKLQASMSESAEEWQTQKQQTRFASDWEWAEHLLAVHQKLCDKKDCKHGECTTTMASKPVTSPSNVCENYTGAVPVNPVVPVQSGLGHSPPVQPSLKLFSSYTTFMESLNNRPNLIRLKQVFVGKQYSQLRQMFKLRKEAPEYLYRSLESQGVSFNEILDMMDIMDKYSVD